MLNKLKEEGGNVAVAVAIIVAGVIIAAAVVFTGGTTGQPGQNGENNPAQGTQQEAEDVPGVSEEDYIYGNADAPIKIVEYSDPECPFCVRLHSTLKQIVADYDGQVAWVYRHFNTGLHNKMLAEVTSAECAGELGGNDAYWNYLNKIYDNTDGNDQLDLDLLPQFAQEVGLDLEAFNQCVDSGRHLDKVQNHTDDAAAAGGRGTPFSVIITPEGNQLQVSGAQPINVWKQAIDLVIQNELTEQE